MRVRENLEDENKCILDEKITKGKERCWKNEDTGAACGKQSMKGYIVDGEAVLQTFWHGIQTRA